MALIRIPGSAQRYLDTDTGETISRRQRDKIERANAIQQRETAYKLEKQERRRNSAFIPRQRLADNKRYWLQRYSEQMAVRRGISDRQAIEIARKPGSEFNRLWAQAERQGFEGGSGSAWDRLAQRSGAKGGEENENERNKYLAVIAWYMRNEEIGQERFVERDARGRFVRHGQIGNAA